MLNQFSQLKSTVKKRKRAGRGHSSGLGKTCGGGHKGQKSRKGVSINGFEGGQMPIYRRVPKIGFNNPFSKTYQIVKIAELNKLLDNDNLKSGDKVDKDVLFNNKLINCILKPVKILGGEDLKSPLKISADKLTKSAVKSIESVSGEILDWFI